MTHISFSTNLKLLITDKIVTPVFNHPSTTAWDREVASKIVNGGFEPLTKTHHRNILVQQGQGDFVNGVNGLTPDNLTLLYCYYYFQMHFSSTVAMYYHYRDLLINEVFKPSKKIVFIDVGSGPFTSGISFLHYTKLRATRDQINPLRGNLQIEYYGIDNADSMRSMGNTLLTKYEATSHDNDFRYFITNQNSNYENIPNLIGKRDNQTTIIINCCYFFASTSINVTNFTQSIQQLINDNPSSKILLFYQNANSDIDILRVNYRNFREGIKGLNETGNVEQLPFSFDDEFNSTNYKPFRGIVKIQLLKNY